MPSKESLERAEKYWLTKGPRGTTILALADLLDEAIREVRVAEAEWWFNQYCPTEDPKAYQRIAQLREGKP